MISFDKPAKLDGAKLISELEATGIKVKANKIGAVCPIIDGSGILWLNISSADKEAAQLVVDNHKG